MIIQINSLDGYDHQLESKRQVKFREFLSSYDANRRKRALKGVASLTALRSATFISEYEKAFGIYS